MAREDADRFTLELPGFEPVPYRAPVTPEQAARAAELERGARLHRAALAHQARADQEARDAVAGPIVPYLAPQ